MRRKDLASDMAGSAEYIREKVGYLQDAIEEKDEKRERGLIEDIRKEMGWIEATLKEIEAKRS